MRALQALRKRCGELVASRRASLCACLALGVALFALGSVAWVPTGLYDDWSISNALSANWGQDEGLCLFLNAGLARTIFALNAAVPSVNWFFMLERLSGLVAFCTLAYLSITRLHPAFAAACIGGAAVILVPGCTYETNFTYVAGACVCAGGFGLLVWMCDERLPRSLAFGGIALMVLGGLWRWTMLVLAVPVFGIAALLVAFGCGEGEGGGLLGRGVRLWPFAVVLACLGVAMVLNAAAWAEPPWSEWYEFNELRSDISDYSYGSYDDYAAELSTLGVSENDYRLLKSWVSEDPAFFDVERLQQIKDVVTAERGDASRYVGAVASYAFYAAGSVRLVALLASVLVAALAVLRGRRLGFALAIVAGTLLLAAAMYAFGRLPARVHLPLLMYAATCAAAFSARGVAKAQVAPDDGVGCGRVASLATGFTSILATASLVFVAGTCFSHLNASRLVALVDEPAFEPQGDLVDYLNGHPDTVYALNVASNARLVYANVMMAPLGSDVLGHTYSIGGWAAHAPYAQARNARLGIENPIKDLVDNDNVLFICGDEQAAERLRTYLREHYYADAQFRQVDTVGDPSGGLVVVDFYRESSPGSGSR